MSDFRPLLSASAEEIAAEYGKIAATAMVALEDKGLRIRNDPNMDRPVRSDNTYYNGEVPSNLDELDNRELTEIMSLHAGWTRYINAQLAEAEAQVKVHKRWEKALSAALEREKVPSVDDDKRYIAVTSDLLYWEVILTYLEALKSDASNDYKTISRIITVRGLDAETQGRVAAIKNQGQRNPFKR